MRILAYTLIFLFVSMSSTFAEDSSLLIKCPEGYKIAINGYTQNIGGKIRQYTFDFPKGEQGKVKVLAFTDDSPKVLHSSEVIITGGLTVTLDLRDEKEKELDKPKIVKPSFNIFEKPVLQKPDFSCITKIPKGEPKENVQLVRPKIQNSPVYQDCPTGTCSTGR